MHKNHLAVLIIIGVLLHLWLFYHFGIRTLFDSTGYLKAADYLQLHGNLEDVHLTFYAIPIILISVFKWVFSGDVIPYLIFQCILSGLGLIALYMAGLKVYGDPIAAFCSCLLFLCWLDNIQWNTTIMTESISNSIACLLICAIAYFNGTLKGFLLILTLLVVSVFTRPTGIVMIVGTLVFFALYYWKFIMQRPIRVVLLLSCFLLLSYMGAVWMFNHWDFTEQYAKGNIITYADHIEGTSLFHENMRVNTADIELPDAYEPPLIKAWQFIIDNPVLFLKSFILKVAYLLSFWRPYYSVTHNVYSIIWVTLVYVLYFWGWKKVKEFPVRIYTLTIIIVNCCLIGISSVDWDNRFYLPMEPGLVLLAGGGAASLLTLIKTKLKIMNPHDLITK